MQIKGLLEFAPTIDNLTADYIHLKNLEQEIKRHKGMADMMHYGKKALSEARRIQEEFFPMSDISEEIVMTLLNQKFVYDQVDYSDELTDKLILHFCDAGLLLYVSEAISEEINTLNKIINDLEAEKVF